MAEVATLRALRKARRGFAVMAVGSRARTATVAWRRRVGVDLAWLDRRVDRKGSVRVAPCWASTDTLIVADSRSKSLEVAEHLEQQIAEHRRVLDGTFERVKPAFVEFVAACQRALAEGRKLMFFGNGGSAADAQHLATELVVRYRENRPALAALSLSTDTSALTAIGNDFGYADVFARQLEALCQPGDVVIAISTSGNSENVLRALAMAKKRGAVTVGFSGETGGRMRPLLDYALLVPSTNTARIQEMHILLGHTLCGQLEALATEGSLGTSAPA
jgi:D-sedoheptulose 7-phosphate isomerase